MRSKPKYIKTNIRRTLKYFPSVLIITLITICAIAFCAYVAMNDSSDNEENQKVRIGIVGQDSDTYLGIGISVLKNMDSTKDSIDFVEMSEGDAIASLESGTIAGYIIMPDNFIDGIVRGENIPATYVMNNSAENFGSVVTGEIANTMSGYVMETQKAVYALKSISREFKVSREINTKIDDYNLMYFDFILNRNDMCDVQIVGVADQLSTGGYYICGILMLFMMLWGISCCNLLVKRDTGLMKFMKTRGIGSVRQVIGEYIGYVTFTLIMFVIFAVIGGIAIDVVNVDINELQGAGIADTLGFVMGIIPVVIMMCAMHMAVYEAIENMVGAIFFQFIIAIGLGYISGCMYPGYFFPESVQQVVSFLPSGAGFSYMRKLMSGGAIFKDICIICGYCAVFFAAICTFRKHRMAGDIG